jgi:hypothetical protein
MRLIDNEISMSARHETKQQRVVRASVLHTTLSCTAARSYSAERETRSIPHATRPVNVPALSSSVLAKVRLHGLIPCACKQTVHVTRLVIPGRARPGHAWSQYWRACRVSVPGSRPAACWLAAAAESEGGHPPLQPGSTRARC